MILGIISSGEGRTTPPVDPYDNAYLIMDFQNGVYRVDGVNVAVSTLLDRVDTIDNSGLNCDWYQVAAPFQLQATALAAIADREWTVVIELYHREYSTGNVFFAAEDGQTDWAFLWGEIRGVSGVTNVYDQAASVYRDLQVTTPALGATVMKFAITRSITRLSVSANGGAVETNTTNSVYMPMFDIMSLGGFVDDTFFDFDGYIRSVIFYPPIDDADLPARSSL